MGNAAITGGMKDEILVCGYLRKIVNNLPTDLVREIAKWFSKETLHWIEHGVGSPARKHYGLSLSAILNSLQIVIAEPDRKTQR